MKKYLFLLYSLIYLGNLESAAQYRVLHNFNDTDGVNPWGLMQTRNRLYGMTYKGGAYGDGIIYSLDTNGNYFKDVFDFNNTPDGFYPTRSLIISGDTMYGNTELGGAGSDGVLFSVDSNGTGYKILVNFSGPNGSDPETTMVLSGNTLFGMTYNGGINSYGNIYSVKTDGTGFKDLLDFDITNGQYTYSSLALSGNQLFGMTYEGGLYGYGTIFSVDTDGTHYKLLHSFDMIDGEHPYNDLLVSGNKLFCVASYGALYDSGCIFSIDTNGSGFKDLFDFRNIYGTIPNDIFISGNLIFGTTVAGGAHKNGCIYTIDTNGTGYRDLYDFEYSTGWKPLVGLIHKGNLLYGTTYTGGTYNDGVVFTFRYYIDEESVNNISSPYNNITLSPNPSTGIFTISLTGAKNISPSTIEVFNILGERVLNETLRGTQGNKVIDLTGQPNGVYYYRVADESEVIGSGKIVVEK